MLLCFTFFLSLFFFLLQLPDFPCKVHNFSHFVGVVVN